MTLAAAVAALTITIQAPLVTVFTPLNQSTVPCDAAPGTVVTSLDPGGYGFTSGLAIIGDTIDFALSGTDLVVGPNRIAAAVCGQAVTVSLTEIQP